MMKGTERKLRGAVALAAVGAVIALSGCGASGADDKASSASQQTGTNPPSQTGTKYKSVTIQKVGSPDDLADITSMCGDKPATVGVIDGYGLNSYSKAVKAEAQSEIAKCPNLKMLYAAAKGDVQAQNAAIKSLAAQGANVIVINPDAGPGEAVLPNERQAFRQGVMVVNFDQDAGGKPGKDYLDYADDYLGFAGQGWADWTAKALGADGGNVVYLGGPAGSTHSAQIFAGFVDALKKHPKVHLLNKTPARTNWDAPSSQKAMSGLLAKYSKVDAVVGEIGETQEGAIRAFEIAGRPLVPMVTGAQNSLNCDFAKRSAKNPEYQTAGYSTRTWMVRVAIRRGVAAFEGTTDDEPSIFKLDLVSDSLSDDPDLAPAKSCVQGAPPDFDPSAQLSAEEIAKAFR